MEGKPSESTHYKLRKMHIRQQFAAQRRCPPSLQFIETKESIEFDEQCLDFLCSYNPYLAVTNQSLDLLLPSVIDLLQNKALRGDELVDKYLLYYIQKYIVFKLDDQQLSEFLDNDLMLKLASIGLISLDDLTKVGLHLKGQISALRVLLHISSSPNLTQRLCELSGKGIVRALSKYVFSDNESVSSFSLWIINNFLPEFKHQVDWDNIIPFARAKIENATILNRPVATAVWTLSKYIRHVSQSAQEAMSIMGYMRRFLSIQTDQVRRDAFAALASFTRKFKVGQYLASEKFYPNILKGLKDKKVQKEAIQSLQNLQYSVPLQESPIPLDIKQALFELYETPLQTKTRSLLLRTLSNILIDDYKKVDQKFMGYICHLISAFTQIQYPVEVISDQLRLIGNVAKIVPAEILLSVFTEDLFEFVIDKTRDALFQGKQPSIEIFGLFIISKVLEAETAQSDQKLYLEFAFMKNLEGMFDLVDPNSKAHQFVKEMQEAYFNNQDFISQAAQNKEINL